MKVVRGDDRKRKSALRKGKKLVTVRGVEGMSEAEKVMSGSIGAGLHTQLSQ